MGHAGARPAHRIAQGAARPDVPISTLLDAEQGPRYIELHYPRARLADVSASVRSRPSEVRDIDALLSEPIAPETSCDAKADVVDFTARAARLAEQWRDLTTRAQAGDADAIATLAASRQARSELDMWRQNASNTISGKYNGRYGRTAESSARARENFGHIEQLVGGSASIGG